MPAGIERPDPGSSRIERESFATKSAGPRCLNSPPVGQQARSGFERRVCTVRSPSQTRATRRLPSFVPLRWAIVDQSDNRPGLGTGDPIGRVNGDVRAK